jgi:FkbM family methyltransferase
VVAGLNRAQFRHPRLGRFLRVLARFVASGETVIQRGPAAGLRIDATGTNAGYALGTSGPAEQRWLCRHLSPGDVLFDIGANVGFLTVLGARLVGEQGFVVAFEPVPENALQLKRNVQLNDFRHVIVVEAAISDQLGTASFVLPPGRRDGGRLASQTERESPTTEVQVLTIDHWLREFEGPKPTVLKIDAEGAEIDVLRGSQDILRTERPAILVEVHWLGQPFVEFIQEELAPLGYVARLIGGGALPTDVRHYHAEIVAE